jgi:hypothetical protein
MNFRQNDQIRSQAKMPLSVSKLLSALSSAARENLAAVSVCHSFAETVFHLSVSFLGLVSSFHFAILLSK